MHVEGDMFALLAEEKFLLAGGTLAYGSFPVRTEFCGHEWYLQIAGKGIMRDVVSAQVIDCSGDASFVRLAGSGVPPGNAVADCPGGGIPGDPPVCAALFILKEKSL